MTLLKTGQTVDDPRLDRIPTGHTVHLDRYPLTADTAPAEPTPIQIGVNWYSNFDRPVSRRIRGRNFWVIGDGDLGQVRGGHATCLKPPSLVDLLAWWIYYNQGQEGRCVEFSGLRLLSLLNRKRYDITSRWHYLTAQDRDYWPGRSPAYEGTSVDAFMQVAAREGVIPARRGGASISYEQAAQLAQPDEGIAAYRWATSWQQVRQTLQLPDWMPGAPMLNSWGRGYPRLVLLLDAAGERVLREDGEMAVVTDR